MFDKLKAFWDLFHKGEEVADPEKWKARQISASVIAGAIMAAVKLAGTFGIDIPVDSDTSLLIAGGVLATVNVVLTMVTSKKAGLQAKVDPIDYSQSDLPRNNR